jgi:tetratricopeptide (TPR) repeat protein
VPLGADTLGDFDDNLNHAIKKLREALGDSAEKPRFVKTLPRRGYQFLISTAPPFREPTNNGTQPPPATRLRPGLAMALSISLLGILAAVSGAWWMGHRSRLDEAEQAYRSGLELLRRRDRVSAERSADLLRNAVELNPRFAKAWAGLVEAAIFVNENDPSTVLELARQSEQMDAGCGECHAIMGFVLFSRYWKWREAGEYLSRAIALNPGDPQIHTGLLRERPF